MFPPLDDGTTSPIEPEVDQPPMPAEPVTSEATTAAAFTAIKRVLLVDDDRDFLQSLALRCQSAGLDVVTAGTVLTAMTLVGLRPPDLICLDVDMPTGSGLNVCELLARDPNTAHIPIIVLTGAADRGTIYRCAELKAYYVHKSGDAWRRLRPVIEELLDISLESPTSS